MFISNTSFNEKDVVTFSANYAPAKRNVDSLKDARIIVLLERHYSSHDQERNAWLINKLYKEGDIVLVESPDNTLDQTFHQVALVDRKITVYGWDCAKCDEELHEAKQPKYDLGEKAFQLNYSGEGFTQLLKNAIRNCPLEEQERFNRRLEEILKVSPNEISVFNRRALTNLLINDIYPDDKGKIYEALRKTFPIRQQKLIERCKEYLQADSNRRIFITTGRAHALLKEEEEYKEIFEEGVKAFHAYLETTEFVIFDHLIEKPTKELSDDVQKNKT